MNICVKALRLVCVFALLLGCAVPFAQAATSAQSKDELKKMLREVFKENPDLVMEVLRRNSEEVLDIAQEGSLSRNRKVLVSRWTQDMQTPKSVKMAKRPTLGPDNAPVTIVAFTDFTCAYCQQAEETILELYNQYKGKVRVLYKSLPMKGNPGSLEAAEFMLAAYQLDKSKSWQLSHDFFSNRAKIISPQGDSFLRSAVISRGFDMKKFLPEVKSSTVKNILREDEEDAKKLDFAGTPSFLVNNIVIKGALPKELFQVAVEMALAEAGQKNKKK